MYHTTEIIKAAMLLLILICNVFCVTRPNSWPLRLIRPLEATGNHDAEIPGAVVPMWSLIRSVIVKNKSDEIIIGQLSESSEFAVLSNQYI